MSYILSLVKTDRNMSKKRRGNYMNKLFSLATFVAIVQYHDILVKYDLVGGLEHFFIFPYIGDNHPN